MLYMVIGRFRRVLRHDAGRSEADRPVTETPDVTRIGSWVDATLGRSFQVVECDNILSLQQWAARWRHRVELEIVPVVSARDAVVALEPLLG